MIIFISSTLNRGKRFRNFGQAMEIAYDVPLAKVLNQCQLRYVHTHGNSAYPLRHQV
jgi:hypothetical protein